jgi:serine/alanine adding enzyme
LIPMGDVEIIDPVRDPRWDTFVEAHPYGWICHLSGWKEVLEKSFPHMKGYYFVLLDDTRREIKAGMPVFEVRSWLTGKRLVSIPFATLSDPLVSSNEHMELLLDAAVNVFNKLRSSYLEIRTLSSSPFIQTNRLGDTRFYKHHYLMLKNEPEQLKKKFHRTCVRQRISRSIESDLKLKMAENESDLHRFYTLHKMTRKKVSLPPQPYSFFKHLWETFSPSKRMTVLLAEKEGTTIAGQIIFKFRERVSVEFAASDEAYVDSSPNHFLFWEAIKAAQGEGFKIFDFGRTSPDNKSLMDFKRHWGTDVVDLPEYYYPKDVAGKMQEREKSFAYKLVKGICRQIPDYALEPIGRLCYRHLG